MTDFKNKYLKYKFKYLKLKNQTGGNKFIITDHSCDVENYAKFIDFIKSNNQLIIKIYQNCYYFVELVVKDKDYNVVVFIDNKNQIILYFLNNLCTYDVIQKELERLTRLDEKEMEKLTSGEYITEFDDSFDENNYKNSISGFIASNSFIQLFFTSSDTITTKFDFNLIDEENTKLGTIMKLLDIFYMYFCYDKIKLYDVANFQCPGLITDDIKYDNGIKYEYNAVIYRIFATDKSIDDISIYHKYGYNYDCSNKELDFVRNYSIGSFIKVADKYIKANDNFFKSFDASLTLVKMKDCLPSMRMCDFFKHIQMNTIASCQENFRIFNFINKIARFVNHSIDETGFIAKLQNLVICVGSLKKKLNKK